MAWFGQAALLAGRWDAARAHAQRALTLAEAHTAWGEKAYAPRLWGELHASVHPPHTVAASYRQALALADNLGRRPLQAHCHYGLGTLYAQTGRQEHARPDLAAAMALYRSMAMPFWLARAEAALAQVEGRP